MSGQRGRQLCCYSINRATEVFCNFNDSRARGGPRGINTVSVSRPGPRRPFRVFPHFLPWGLALLDCSNTYYRLYASATLPLDRVPFAVFRECRMAALPDG